MGGPFTEDYRGMVCRIGTPAVLRRNSRTVVTHTAGAGAPSIVLFGGGSHQSAHSQVKQLAGEFCCSVIGSMLLMP